MFKKTVLAVALALGTMVGGAATAATVNVGDAAINRQLSDGFSNFVVGFTNENFVDGTLTGWEVYVERINGNASSGSLALLVLTSIGGGNYQVTGIDTRTVQVGLNTFTSSIATTATSILGVFMGTAKVSYDLISQPSGPDVYNGNGAVSSPLSVGSTVALTAGSTDRIYSINATVAPVPLPAAGFLLIGALGGLAALRRRKMVA